MVHKVFHLTVCLALILIVVLSYSLCVYACVCVCLLFLCSLYVLFHIFFFVFQKFAIVQVSFIMLTMWQVNDAYIV